MFQTKREYRNKVIKIKNALVLLLTFSSLAYAEVTPKSTAPDFKLNDLSGVEHKLSDFKGKYLVLFFYPLDFTFVCPTEIIAFSNKAKEFREIGVEIVAASIDSKFSHMEYCLKPRKEGGLGGLDIPLLSDVNKKIARDYGCLIE